LDRNSTPSTGEFSQDFALGKQFTHEPPAFFFFLIVYFSDRFLLTLLSRVAGIIGVYHHAQLRLSSVLEDPLKLFSLVSPSKRL
jgi:hypothetical protein